MQGERDSDYSEEMLSQIDISDVFVQDYDKHLVLMNDNNTFDTVIKALMEVMNYSQNLSVFVANLVDKLGGFALMTGREAELRPFMEKLQERGLTVKIIL